jgi:hypothetical protein
MQLTMTRSSGSLNPRIRIYSPAGAELCSAFSSNLTAQISTCASPSAGLYTMLADDTFVNCTGSYTLALLCPNQDCVLMQTFLPLLEAPARSTQN